LYHEEIISALKKRFAAEIPEAVINVFPPPASRAWGEPAAFKLMIEDRGNASLSALQRQTNAVIGSGNQQEAFAKSLSTVYKADSPQLFVDVNRDACLAQGINLVDVFGTMQAYLGSRYVTTSTALAAPGRWSSRLTRIQGQRRGREAAGGSQRPRANGAAGTLAEVKPISGPLVLTRYNMYPAAAITAGLARALVPARGTICWKRSLAANSLKRCL